MEHPGPTRHPEAYEYTGTAKALHWTILGLLIVQFALAWTMPGVGRGTEPETLINMHLSFGAVILLLMAARLRWRWTHPAPSPPDGLPGWQLLASRWVHGLLYGLLFAVPILGWMNASYRGWRITLFGVIDLPRLIAPRSAKATSGALYHRFVLQDALLSRMLPNGRPALRQSRR